MKRIYKGGCHCGLVRFECELDLWEGTSKCNCSICTRSRFWKAIARADGWELVVAMREDFLKRSPDAVGRLLRMFQDGQRFIKTNLDDADRIVAASIKLPPGIMKEAVSSGRLVYDVQPAWEAERAVIWDMFKVAVDIGYLPKLPDEGAIYRP